MTNGSNKLNDGRKYCRMLPLEHSAILLICIKTILGLGNQFFVFLRVAIIHRFAQKKWMMLDFFQAFLQVSGLAQ